MIFQPAGLSAAGWLTAFLFSHTDSRHALAYNTGDFLRTHVTPELSKNWSMTSLKEKLIKIGDKVIRHGRAVAFKKR